MATKPAVTFLTAVELAELLATVVKGVAGGTKIAWKNAIGPVERLPTWRHVTHNWSVSPRGTAEQRRIVEQAVQVVRAEHPYIA